MDLARAEELLGEYGEYSHDVKLGRVFGTAMVGEFVELLQAYLAEPSEYERGRKSVLATITYTTPEGAIHNSFHDYVDLREKLQ